MKSNSDERTGIREMVFVSPITSFAASGCQRLVVSVLLCAVVWIGQTVRLAATGPTAIYEQEQLDQMPVPKKPVRFRLPGAVKKRGGEITLRFLVKADGRVDKITVVKFTDDEMIDPVYSAYEKAVFVPGQIKGVPVDTWLTVSEKAK